MIDSPTVLGVEEIRSLATSVEPEPWQGVRTVADMRAAMWIIEQTLLLLPEDIHVVAVGHDHIQLSPAEFRAVFHGLTARVTRSTNRNYRRVWVRGIAITTCEPIEGWQVPQLEASFEAVPEA